MEVVSNIKLLFNYKHAHMNYQVDLSLKQIKTDICYKLKIFSFEFNSISITFENTLLQCFSYDLKLSFFISKNITVCFDLSQVPNLDYELILNNFIEKK